MVVHSPLINVITATARKAARGLIRDFGEVEQLQVSKKGPGDFVSAADRKAEAVIHKELHHARPDYSFLMEESGAVAGVDSSNCWVIDPLDGTLNFLHGIPHFAISIALVREGEPVAAVVYNPITDAMYWAEKGSGAFLNERRLRVSARRKMEDAVISTGFPTLSDERRREWLRQMDVVRANTAGVRQYGSASLDLAFVAAGRFDGYWEFGIKSWDIAAGVLLVREAGGDVTEIDGGRNMLETGSILATNGQLHRELGGLVRG